VLIAANGIDSESICAISTDHTSVTQCGLVSRIVLFTCYSDVKNSHTIYLITLLLDM